VTREIRLPILHDKTGQGRVVPLTDAMWAIIERRWAARSTRRWDGRVLVSPWVFHGPLGGRLKADDVYEAWYAACDAAGVPRRSLHDFRRTVARDAIRGGASEKVAMEMTGHKTASTFKRYQITDTRDVARAQAEMAAFRAAARQRALALAPEAASPRAPRVRRGSRSES
jgi:integrase